MTKYLRKYSDILAPSRYEMTIPPLEEFNALGWPTLLEGMSSKFDYLGQVGLGLIYAGIASALGNGERANGKKVNKSVSKLLEDTPVKRTDRFHHVSMKALKKYRVTIPDDRTYYNVINCIYAGETVLNTLQVVDAIVGDGNVATPPEPYAQDLEQERFTADPSRLGSGQQCEVSLITDTSTGMMRSIGLSHTAGDVKWLSNVTAFGRVPSPTENVEASVLFKSIRLIDGIIPEVRHPDLIDVRGLSDIARALRSY